MSAPISAVLRCIAVVMFVSVVAQAATAPMPAGQASPPVPVAARALARLPASDAVIAEVLREAARDAAQASRPVACDGRHHYGIRYSVRRLQVVGGEGDLPTSLNNFGIVAGYAIAGGISYPVVWIGRRGFNLAAPGEINGVALDINDAGKVVGSVYVEAAAREEASSWFLDRRRNLGSLGDAATSAGATGINRSGAIVGGSGIAGGGAAYAVVWRGGAPRPLATLGGNIGGAARINDRGYIVGASTGSDGQLHASLWRPDGSITDLGTLGGQQSWATDINGRGTVVGYSYKAGDVNIAAFVWRHGALAQLAGLGGADSQANAINDLGQIVGNASTIENRQFGVTWINDAPVRLDTLLDDESQGIAVANAYAINERGQIAAARALSNGGSEPLLLTPRPCRKR